MKFLDEVKQRLWERLEYLKEYSYQYSVEFEGKNVVLKPSKMEESSLNLKLFKGDIDPGITAQIKPIIIDLGDEPIKATVIERLTHDDILSLLEAANAEKIIGEIHYKMPINSVRLTGFPKDMSNNLDGFRLAGNGFFESRNMMVSHPTYATFSSKIEEKLEKLPYVEKIEKKLGEYPTALLSRRPSLSEVEQTALSLSENSDVELVFRNLKKSQIAGVNRSYDSSLKEVNGDLASAYNIQPGKLSNTTSISIRPPFERTVEALERSLGDRVVYTETIFR